jgi:uncharacterized paraquat-inducible protein A
MDLAASKGGFRLPYFKCPNCAVLVHLLANTADEIECSRCQVPLRQEGDRTPRELLSGVIGRARGPGGNSKP